MKIVLLILISFLSLYSCNTGPDFERNNENDPESKSFVPNVNSLQARINPDKSVSLRWFEDSNFEDGFIISKSLGEDSEFFVLDTVLYDSPTYIDSSYVLNKYTSYKVRGLSLNSNVVETTEGAVVSLNFGSFERFVHTSNLNEINLNWRTEASYSDKFLLERITQGTTSVIDTIDGSLTQFSYTELEEVYNMDIKITGLLLDNTGNYVRLIESNRPDISFNLPSNLSVDVIDEATISVSWQDNNHFEDEIIVFQSNNSSSSSEISNTHYPIDTLTTSGSNVILKYSPEQYYDISIAPFHNGYTEEVVKTVRKHILTTPPDIISIETITTSEVKISWNDLNYRDEDARYPTESFILELSTNDEDFIPFKVLDRETTSIILRDLNIEDNYTFRIRSISSAYRYGDFEYFLSLNEEGNLDVNNFDLSGLNIINDESYFYSIASSTSNENDFLILFNTSTGFIEKELFIPGTNGSSISSDGNLFAISSNDGINVYDISGNTTVLNSQTNIHSGMFQFIGSDSLIFLREGGIDLLTISSNITSTLISEIDNLDELYVSKNKKTVYWFHKKTIFQFDLDNQILTETSVPSPPVIIDNNNLGEILVWTEGSILLIDKNGSIVQEYDQSVVNDINSFLKATFYNDNFVVIGAEKGIHFFHKYSGEYISSTGLNYSEIVGLSSSKKTNKVMAVDSNNKTAIFTAAESWSFSSIRLKD